VSNLFLIIVAAGKIGGVAGPLPYDMDECQRRRAEMADAVVEAWKKPEVVAKLKADDPAITVDAYRFECRHLAEKPALGSEYVP